MSIRLVSISHKTAPLSVRELFAFSKEGRAGLMHAIIDEGGAAECVVIATCNRTEVYAYFEEDAGCRGLFKRISDLVIRQAKADAAKVTDYLRFYQDEKAVRHLFSVAAGLDSMVVGEEQILAQVKDAASEAQKEGTSGSCLNTLFRYAVTCSKRIRTETGLSKTSVSTATLALRAVSDVLGGLEDKRVMVIGGTGKIGGVVLKNLCSRKGVHIYSTVRNITLTHDEHIKSESNTFIDYHERYDYIDEMDAVISATASPHYTLTAARVRERAVTEKPRVFVDLAVPPDIDAYVASIPGAVYRDLDDIGETARANNHAKEKAVSEAGAIMDDYVSDFMCRMIFQRHEDLIGSVKAWIEEEAGRKGMDYALDRLFYRIRENASPQELEAFFRCISDGGE